MIKFGDIKINDLSKKHVLECLETSQITMGPKVALFEKEWATLFEYPHSVAFNSGTSSLIAALIALYDYGAKPGDGIICPALSFIASANAIRAAGFRPVFVDVRKHDLQINEELVKWTIENHGASHISGIVGVNLMGHPCRLDVLQDIAEYFKIKLIVDNCEAYGCKLYNKYSLEYADMEVTSHYIAHIIQSCEMGTVSTYDKKTKDILKSIRSHGRQPDSLYFDHSRYGLNLKPTDLHASIGLGQLPDFWIIFNKRKDILKRYSDAIDGYKDKFYLVEESPGVNIAPHAFSLTLKEAYATDIYHIKTELDAANIQWKRNFQSMPKSGAFNYLNDFKSYPNAEYISNHGIHIGCSDLMTDENVEFVCDTLEKICEKIK